MSADIDGVALWKLFVFPTAKKKKKRKVNKSKEKWKRILLLSAGLSEGRETHQKVAPSPVSGQRFIIPASVSWYLKAYGL